jgi:histidinol-phosphate aminotransferase
MGLLDHYRQYAGMSDAEVAADLRARADDRRRRELARRDVLDLGGIHWHEFPHPDVVAAITYAARQALNLPPDPHATELRVEIARRHGLEPERVVAGHGAAQLIQSALRTLLEPGEEVVLPWPAYRQLPAMVRRAGGRAVPVPGFLDPDRLLGAVSERTRAVIVCNPNDPTGEWLEPGQLAALATALPERVWLLLDEALADYVEPALRRASLALLDEHPRLLVFCTLSKAYGLAGLRCGWALGPAGAADDLGGVAPAGALASPVQAGALEALVECGPLVQRRRAQVAAERARIASALAAGPYGLRPGRANLLWLRLPGMSGPDLAGRLERAGVRVAAGAAWGDDEHIRAQVQSPAASERLLAALTTAPTA